MSENKNIDELSYNQMQEMLPDYVFNRVSMNDALIFEENLLRYPELIKEIRDVRRVFGNVEKMDLNNTINQKTRHLSIKVRNGYKKDCRKPQNSILGFRYIMPIIAILAVSALFYSYFQSQSNSTNETKQSYTENIKEIVKPQEVLVVMSDTSISDDDYIEITNELSSDDNQINMDELILDKETFNESLDEYLSSLLFDEISEDDYFDYMNSTNESNNIFIPIDEISEDDFQLILKDIENEKFL